MTADLVTLKKLNLFFVDWNKFSYTQYTRKSSSMPASLLANSALSLDKHLTLSD